MSEECRQFELTYGTNEMYIRPQDVHVAETDVCPIHRVRMERVGRSHVLPDMDIFICFSCGCYYVYVG